MKKWIDKNGLELKQGRLYSADGLIYKVTSTDRLQFEDTKGVWVELERSPENFIKNKTVTDITPEENSPKLYSREDYLKNRVKDLAKAILESIAEYKFNEALVTDWAVEILDRLDELKEVVK